VALQDLSPEPLKQPFDPALAMPGEPQEEFLLMTAVSDVPDMDWQIVTVSSWRARLPKIVWKIALKFTLVPKTCF
jgi:hypothetical protein